LILLNHTLVSLDKRRPDIEVDPNTGATIFTFYYGPAVENDDGNGNITVHCPSNDRNRICKRIVIDGVNGDVIPAGSVFDIWVNDEDTGHGYLNCNLISDFDINNDSEIFFHRDMSIPIENDYDSWYNKAINN
jgi:hypothetical protein